MGNKVTTLQNKSLLVYVRSKFLATFTDLGSENLQRQLQCTCAMTWPKINTKAYFLLKKCWSQIKKSLKVTFSSYLFHFHCSDDTVNHTGTHKS